MQFFGEATEKANNVGERIGIRGPRNLLELLPDTFSREDATRIRRKPDARFACPIVRKGKTASETGSASKHKP